MARPRVLLVEDDASLRLFVQMALEELDLELLQADSVAAALPLLANAPVQLILTDLMMPGESGLDLLERLRLAPALRNGAKVVVLSAGVTTAMREQLQMHQVWQVLLKPVSVLVLENCVREALAAAGTVAASVAIDTVGTSQRQTVQDALAPAQQQALAQFFGGDRKLFDSYAVGCLAQFANDVRTGDAAMAQADMSAMRHLAHSLKTVLRTLGYPQPSSQAHALEEASMAAQQQRAQTLWMGLRGQLQQLTSPSAATG